MKPRPTSTLAGKNPRREFMLAAGGVAAGIALSPAALAQSGIGPGRSSRPTQASAAATLQAVHKVAGTATINKGRVTVDLPALIDNGNGVPLTVSVDSPMTEADHVKAIHVFAEKNPLPNVVSFQLGPRAARARVATRIRLADTQTVFAICELSDGSFWSGSVDVVVAIAACLEEL
ncbi:MAG: SoxY-related AACIE arm protein [Proteobacteria bacterium]|nr:SoxY-related AACIE arm protein [Pseudomonadota bacterium]